MAIVIDYREDPRAAKRWADMQKFNELKALGLVPNLPPAELDAWANTPSEFVPVDAGWPDVAPERDGA